MIENNLIINNYIQKFHLNSHVAKNLNSQYKKKINQIKDKIKIPNQFFNLFNKDYNFSVDISDLKKFNGYKSVALIGMGGSILGAEAIYNFFKKNVKKDFYFLDDLDVSKIIEFKKKIRINKTLFIVISKSGNTIETLSNLFYLDILKKNSKNIIIITEKKDNILYNISKKFNLFFVEHKNYIGGRYSVLSEVGMVPAELMGLNEKKFKQLNYLIKNKAFINFLIQNVSSIHSNIIKGKKNCVILNYDEKLNNFLKWYQQLSAESLGKKGNGFFPIISTMPKDNHSLLQLYLDGPKNNFFSFFFSRDRNQFKFNNAFIIDGLEHLKKKSLDQVMYAQKKATQNVFNKKKLSFRSFEIKNKSEETLGELFTFFILETLMLSSLLNVNPINQPSVELIKIETKKILK